MFTQQNPRTTARGPLRSRMGRIAAVVATLAVGGTFALAAPLSASAQDRPASYAKGNFLSGSVLGTNLSNLAKLAYAEAHNDGTQGTQTAKDPFKATVLNAVQVGDGQSVQLGLGQFLQLGAVAQYATAKNDGSSLGASGAVADDGAIGVGSDTSTPPANATFDLSKLLGSQFASTLADLKLQIGAVAAQASGNLNTASGDYNLAGAKLTFTSPAISQLTQKVDTALDSVNSDLNRLTGKNGDLLAQLNKVVQAADPALNLLGADANVSATIDTGDLKSLVQSILTSQYGNGAVAFNLETGVVTIDLAKLLGGKLNDLAPGTELISDTVINGVLDGITSTVSTLADQVIDKVKDALNNAKVTLTAHVATDVAQSPVVQQVCQTVQKIIQVPVQVPVTGNGDGGATGSNPIGGLVGGVVGGLGGVLGNTGSGGTTGNTAGGVLGTVTQLVNQTVDQLVCHDVTSAVAPLHTTVDVNVAGTVNQLVKGVGATATANLNIGGIVNTGLQVNAILSGLKGTLTNDLLGTDGTITKLTNALNDGLVHPAVTALTGPSDNSVDFALSKLLSVKVNLQETTLAGSKGDAVAAGSMFTETAVRVTVLGGAGGSSLATVNLAQATVGPNITSVIDDPGCTQNCSSNPGCTSNCDSTSGNPSNPTASSVDRLATTGISIAALVALMLALLAAGAYLVRESYRRSHSVTPIE